MGDIGHFDVRVQVFLQYIVQCLRVIAVTIASLGKNPVFELEIQLSELFQSLLACVRRSGSGMLSYKYSLKDC